LLSPNEWEHSTTTPPSSTANDSQTHRCNPSTGSVSDSTNRLCFPMRRAKRKRRRNQKSAALSYTLASEKKEEAGDYLRELQSVAAILRGLEHGSSVWAAPGDGGHSSTIALRIAR
jgi:hypothetical protein